jgi:predicted transcriptional regulator
MDFQSAAELGGYLAKDYAEEFFRLLVNYQDISASEAASRLGLHIRTAQDFLEGLTELGILQREEVYEKKRPYYRYVLKTERIKLEVDLTQFEQTHTNSNAARRIREKNNSGANFSLARGGEYIGHVSLWTGEGRDRKERKISLTQPQGRFLYHLPFPNADFLRIDEIMRKAEVAEDSLPEILDIVDVLGQYGTIEFEKGRELR